MPKPITSNTLFYYGDNLPILRGPKASRESWEYRQMSQSLKSWRKSQKPLSKSYLIDASYPCMYNLFIAPARGLLLRSYGITRQST